MPHRTRPLDIPDHILAAADQVADYFEFHGRFVWKLGRIQAFVPMPTRMVDIPLPIQSANDSTMADLEA
jgi:hypothetical protein